MGLGQDQFFHEWLEFLVEVDVDPAAQSDEDLSAAFVASSPLGIRSSPVRRTRGHLVGQCTVERANSQASVTIVSRLGRSGFQPRSAWARSLAATSAA